MPTIFHIIDAIVEDVEGDTPVLAGNISDDDAEVRKIASRYKKKETEFKSPDKLALNIYLFGKTAEGEAVRACIEGFQPFFYVRLPVSGSKI